MSPLSGTKAAEKAAEAERLVAPQAGVEDVLDAQQHGHLHAATAHSLDNLRDADADASFRELDVDGDCTVLGEVEITRPPIPDAV